MGDLKNLVSREAKEKLKEMCTDIRICMFCTDLGNAPINTRPMSVQEVDEEGNIWFISSKSSNKNFEIREDNRVQLIFSDAGDSKYLSVFGYASIYRDKATIEKMWSPIAKAWFEEGKNDPDVSIIKVAPLDAYYWDTKDGKIISLLKIAASMATGKAHLDGSVEGSMNV